jgi:hypothetical protein
VRVVPKVWSSNPDYSAGCDYAVVEIGKEFSKLALRRIVLVEPEMEKRRSPLVSIPPFGRGFSRHGVFRPDGGWAAQERVLTPRFIVSMSPPGYPSAWLHPCRSQPPFHPASSL